MKKLIALLSILVLASCSKEDPIKYFKCSGDDKYYFTTTIDTSNKELFWIDNQKRIKYSEKNNELISEKDFMDWEIEIKNRIESINRQYADGDIEYDVNSSIWFEYLNPEVANDDFDEYKIYTFNKISGELTEDYFLKDESISTSYNCEATEPALK